MKLVSLYIPEDDVKKLDGLVNDKRFPNRSEAIRFAIHDMTKTNDGFMADPRVEGLAKICVAWNKRQHTDKEAMWQIWNLFEKDNLKLWNSEVSI